MQDNSTLNPTADASRNPARRRQQRARRQVNHHLQPAVKHRNTSSADVLSAIALPITLPIRCAWWMLRHPYETTLLACILVALWMLLPLEVQP